MKLLTWNTQGERWNSIKDRINQYRPDVFCIQEAGNLPAALNFAGNVEHGEPNLIGSYSGLNVWYLPWDRNNGNGNCRCSMAMLFADNGKPKVSWSTEVNKRPIMHKTIGSKFYVLNIHAGGRDYINEAISLASVNGYEKKWIVAGDFNQEADGDLSWLNRRGGTVCAPGKATRPQSKKIIDYAVSVDHLGAASCLPDYGGSDHRCVSIDW